MRKNLPGLVVRTLFAWAITLLLVFPLIWLVMIELVAASR